MILARIQLAIHWNVTIFGTGHTHQNNNHRFELNFPIKYYQSERRACFDNGWTFVTLTAVLRFCESVKQFVYAPFHRTPNTQNTFITRLKFKNRKSFNLKARMILTFASIANSYCIIKIHVDDPKRHVTFRCVNREINSLNSAQWWWNYLCWR